MNKYFFVFAAFALLVSCNPDNNSGTQNNPDELIITGEALDIAEYSATLTGYANLPFDMGDAEVGVMYDMGQSFEDAKKVVATELDGNNKFTVTAIGLFANTTYYYKSYVQNGMAIKYGALKSFTTKESICPTGAVDLGMMMTREDGTTYKLYWAKSNLSESGLCTKEEDYGDYYAWGETDKKSDYSWSTYKFGTREKGPFSKYNTIWAYGTVDNKTVLDQEDDVAHVKLGGKWRMPTYAEWTELRDKCTWKWIDNGNGVRGMLVTASNGNCIFFPAAGIWIDSHLEGGLDDGGYWSSSLDTDYPYRAGTVYFYNDYYNGYYVDRYVGLSIRPVSE